MKTRRKNNETDENQRGDDVMGPRPEDSPVSSPHTHSPVKGGRNGDPASCSGPSAISMLTMLAEVASVTLHTDPSVTDTNTNQKSKPNLPGSRKPSDFEILTLEQVAGMTDNLLVKLFAKFESNEMWKRFTYTCQMLPAACSKYFQSFGSEHKARSGVKAHLQNHLKSLLEVHSSEESRQTYILESVPARNRRLMEQEVVPGKRRAVSSNRASKTSGLPKVISSHEGAAFKINKKVLTDGSRDHRFEERSEPAVANVSLQVPATESKLKRKLDAKEGRVKIKKPKNADGGSFAPVDDCNNNNNPAKIKGEVLDVIEPSCTTPPMQEIVSHDHGYLKASTYIKPESFGASKDHAVQWAPLTAYNEPPQPPPPPPPPAKSNLNQITPVGGGDGAAGSCINVCVGEIPVKDENTLLHQHMNQELEGGIMAQDCGSDATPLPVVGSEVEFTPDQQYKVMRSADLPVVYDHNNPASNIQTVSRIIERDEYKVRKKPKGRAKFIGQSKAEKEMALKLITEIRSQSVMALDPLECKICHPPRLFTALSTLLSHYRSHAGIRPYECRICEAVFTRQHSLNYHMLIHTNQTRFTCVDCGRKFRHPSHFKEHRRRHTGESPYECSDCLMRFKTRNTYKRHLRTRHGKLLTTQGSIIILSQEEADRMKKTQGRKPRRPRQPLQIISPETAAQIEEEQIWTDFEEGDREGDDEEEDEEDEEEEDDEHSPLDLTKMADITLFDSRASSTPDACLKQLVVPPKANGKTGVLVRPTKVSVNTGDLVSNLGIIVDTSRGGKLLEIKKEEETVFNGNMKEEVLEEVVEDLNTYVFHPASQQNCLPKVNVKSTLNTVNIDLKNSERIANPDSGNATYCDKQAVVETDQTSKVTGQVTTLLPASCSDFLGDNINPEEVITICAAVDNVGRDVVVSPLVKSSQAVASGVKPVDWFTVKKPLKCYSRLGYTPGESNNNIIPSGAAVTTNHVDSQGQGMYFIVQGHDGRLAKVYQSNGTFVNNNKPSQQQQQLPAQATTQVITNPSIDSLHPAKSRAAAGKSAKLESKAPRDKVNAAQCLNSSVSSRVVFKPIKALTHRSVGMNSISDNKVVVNKQVVSNVVLRNHIVQNGNLVKVKCEERDGASCPQKSSSPLVSVVPMTGSVHSSPIIVTSVAPVSKSVDLHPQVIVSSVASVPTAVIPSSNVVVTSVPSNSDSVNSPPVNVMPLMLPSVSLHSSLPETGASVAHVPSVTSPGESADDANEEALSTWQGQSSTGNPMTECVRGAVSVMKGDDVVGDKKTELNHLLYEEVDSLVSIEEDLLLENVEIIENFNSDSSMNVTVNGIVEKNGIVKLDQQLNGGGSEIKDGTNLIAFSNSNVKVEPSLDSHAQYVDRLIQEQIPANNSGSESLKTAHCSSPSRVFPLTQPSQQHHRQAVHTVNHIVSIPSATLKI